ncbi:MAG: hypothetical protein Q4B26_12375 [Eubacteriales bacterium]|nr:hypothetical protein [Eubacteriales bacterium]
MSLVGHCLIQIDYGEGVCFLGRDGRDTTDLQQAMIFEDELEAHIYIEKHRLDRLAKVRRIVASA